VHLKLSNISTAVSLPFQLERERRREGGGLVKRSEDYIALEEEGGTESRLLREDEFDSDNADEDFDDLKVSVAKQSSFAIFTIWLLRSMQSFHHT
jgi:hypothetical protein